MRFNKRYGAVISILALAFMLQCKDNKNPANVVDDSLVGDWTLTRLTIISDQTTVLTETMLGQLGAYWRLNLKSDSTFTSAYNFEEEQNEIGTWTATATDLTLIFNTGGAERFAYSIENGELILQWSDIENGVQEQLTGEFSK